MTPRELTEIERLRESFDNLTSALNRRNAWRRLMVAVLAAALFLLILNSFANRATLGEVKKSSALLVNCTTPGPDPAPVTGNGCWDRLHDPDSTDRAVTTIRCFDLVIAGYRPPECAAVATYIDTLPRAQSR